MTSDITKLILVPLTFAFSYNLGQYESTYDALVKNGGNFQQLKEYYEQKKKSSFSNLLLYYLGSPGRTLAEHNFSKDTK